MKKKKQPMPAEPVILGQDEKTGEWAKRGAEICRDLQETKLKSPSPLNSAETVTVVKTECIAGDGTHEAPYRLCIQYWTLDGILIGEVK
jgi:hypothetical protein